MESSLDGILATYRSTQHITTGVSLAELMIGRRFKMPLDQLRKVQFTRRVHFDPEVDRKSNAAQLKSKVRYDSKHRVRPSNLNSGQQVRVRVPVRDKLDPVWSDPVSIRSTVAPNTVRLDDGQVRNAKDVAPLPPLVAPTVISNSDAQQAESSAQPANPQPLSLNKPTSKQRRGAKAAKDSDSETYGSTSGPTSAPTGGSTSSSTIAPVPPPASTSKNTAPESVRRSHRERHKPAYLKDYVP